MGIKKQRRANARKRPEQAAPGTLRFPRHSLEQALRIPKAMLEQNAGKACSDKEAASYVGVSNPKGPFAVELSSGIKYGLLDRPAPGKIQVTELARSILRPQSPTSRIEALRQAVLKAPTVAEIYAHYRGENIPDDAFFRNTLTDKFQIPSERLNDFIPHLLDTLKLAELVRETDGKFRVIDISTTSTGDRAESKELKKLEKTVEVTSTDTCFVMMPFAAPHGGYYEQIYEPAIRKAKLTPVRADTEIFGAGKIMDQIWRGIQNARVLVAELTTKNPNVFYELGLAHALEKPVVLVSSNDDDVPFDLKHIRVIYYDVTDPFWGQKLLDKIAENVLSAIQNPEEAVFRRREASE